MIGSGIICSSPILAKTENFTSNWSTILKLVSIVVPRGGIQLLVKFSRKSLKSNSVTRNTSVGGAYRKNFNFFCLNYHTSPLLEIGLPSSLQDLGYTVKSPSDFASDQEKHYSPGH